MKQLPLKLFVCVCVCKERECVLACMCVCVCVCVCACGLMDSSMFFYKALLSYTNTKVLVCVGRVYIKA